MAAMTNETFGRHKPPRHCTEARNIKVHPGVKIFKVKFIAPWDGFKAKEEVFMYHLELSELMRTPARIICTEVGESVGDVLLDGVTYRFGHEQIDGTVNKGVRHISARVGAISAAVLAVPPREDEIITEAGEGEGADPTEDERREAEDKQPKSKREAEAQLKPERKRRKPRKKPQEVSD